MRFRLFLKAQKRAGLGLYPHLPQDWDHIPHRFVLVVLPKKLCNVYLYPIYFLLRQFDFFFSILLLLLTTTHCSTKPPKASTAPDCPPHSNLFNASLSTPSGEFPISLKSFLVSSQPNWGRAAFPLALDVWPKGTIFGNMSSFVSRTGPSHLNLSLIVALESGIEPPFSYSLLFEKQSVSWIPRTIRI